MEMLNRRAVSGLSFKVDGQVAKDLEMELQSRQHQAKMFNRQFAEDRSWRRTAESAGKQFKEKS